MLRNMLRYTTWCTRDDVLYLYFSNITSSTLRHDCLQPRSQGLDCIVTRYVTVLLLIWNMAPVNVERCLTREILTVSTFVWSVIEYIFQLFKGKNTDPSYETERDKKGSLSSALTASEGNSHFRRYLYSTLNRLSICVSNFPFRQIVLYIFLTSLSDKLFCIFRGNPIYPSTRDRENKVFYKQVSFIIL